MFQPRMEALAGAVTAPVAPRRGPVAPVWRRWLASGELARLGIGLGSEISTDLGDAIGSRGWWLGLLACTGLCGGALALATLVPPLASTGHPALTPAQHEVLQPQAIAPLALGGVTGATNFPDPALVEPLAEAPERPRIELTARLGSNGDFAAALRRAGVGKDDIAAATALIRPVANLGTLPKGTEVDLVLGRRDSRAVPRPLDLIGFRAAFDLRVAVTRVDGALQLKRIPIAVDSTPLRVRGQVGGSIERSLRAAGVPAGFTGDFIRTMGYAVDFQHGIGKRDRFDIIIARDRAETGEVRYGDMLQATLLREGKDPVELTRFTLGGQPQYFRANGESARKGLMRTPVDGAHLTSGFGMRFHPLLAYSRMHQGIDFGAPTGSPILAAASGTISFAGPHGGHGNYVMLRHTKELTTAYAHMSRFAVRPGQSVTQGQVIGYVGSTGLSTGPHLHYEIWLRGQAVNPQSLKFIGGTQLAGKDLARFQAEAARLRGLGVTGGATAEDGKVVKRRQRGRH